MILITADLLKKIAPGNKQPKLIGKIAAEMNDWFPKFGIDTLPEYRHFIAQFAHETDSFNSLEEYASGSSYEGRKDLGNITAGDGIKFKGRGGFMTTGRVNYQRLEDVSPDWYGVKIPFVKNPHMLVDPVYAIWSACLYWDDKGFNDFANMPDTARINTKKKGPLSPLRYITYRINGGFNGMEDRETFYKRACRLVN